VGPLEVLLVEVKVSAEGPHGEQGAQQGRVLGAPRRALRGLLVQQLQPDQSACSREGGGGGGARPSAISYDVIIVVLWYHCCHLILSYVEV